LGLSYCKGMMAIITKIAEKHGLDLGASEAHLKLTNGSYMPLVIEKVGKDLVTVTHYNSDGHADPDIMFFMYPLGWVPVEITQLSLYMFGREMGGYHHCAEIKDGAIVTYYPHQMAGTAALARTWSTNIREQRWLQRGEKVADDGSVKMSPPGSPLKSY
jgi:hypothetical protein